MLISYQLDIGIAQVKKWYQGSANSVPWVLGPWTFLRWQVHPPGWHVAHLHPFSFFLQFGWEPLNFNRPISSSTFQMAINSSLKIIHNCLPRGHKSGKTLLPPCNLSHRIKLDFEWQGRIRNLDIKATCWEPRYMLVLAIHGAGVYHKILYRTHLSDSAWADFYWLPKESINTRIEETLNIQIKDLKRNNDHPG